MISWLQEAQLEEKWQQTQKGSWREIEKEIEKTKNINRNVCITEED